MTKQKAGMHQNYVLSKLNLKQKPPLNDTISTKILKSKNKNSPQKTQFPQIKNSRSLCDSFGLCQSSSKNTSKQMFNHFKMGTIVVSIVRYVIHIVRYVLYRV